MKESDQDLSKAIKDKMTMDLQPSARGEEAKSEPSSNISRATTISAAMMGLSFGKKSRKDAEAMAARNEMNQAQLEQMCYNTVKRINLN